MSVTDLDIVLYASQNMPQSDSSTSGGDINSGVRVIFTDIAGTGRIKAVSTSIYDSGSLNIIGRDNVGLIINEAITLSGITPVAGSKNFDTILTCSTNALSSGDVTITEAFSGSGIGVIYSNESGFIKPFYDATANSNIGSNKTLYEKIFLKNNNYVDIFSGVGIVQINSGLYSLINFGLEKSQKYNESVSNRTVAPTGVTVYGSGTSGLEEPMMSNSYQGIWLKLNLNAGTELVKSSFYQISVTGQST